MTATKEKDVLKKPPMSDAEKVPVFGSERWLLAGLGLVGFTFVYALRVNISVAVVCMIKPENITKNDTSHSSSPACYDDTSSNSSKTGEFDWGKDIQSSILSSFFYGYLVTQIPGGWLATRFGGKRVLGIGLTIVSIATILLPSLARVDYRLVYFLRVISGLASGVSFPSMHAMWGRWAPPAERARLTSFTYTGVTVGNVLTFVGSGLLCAYGFDNGWGSIFYVTGGGCLIWLIFWWAFVSDSPDTNKRITKAERDYIVNGIGDTLGKTLQMPWLEVAKSPALYFCLTAHFCNNWTHYTLVTSLPTFMKEVLHFDIEQNGVLSAIPYICMAVTTILGGQLADYCRSRWISTRTTRRGFQVTAFVGMGSCLIGVGFVTCEYRYIAVALLSVAVAFEGFNYSGYMVNQIDFAPRYAGVLFGITNLVSTIPGIVAPEVAGALTPNKSQEEWRNVFYVCAAFAATGAVVFGGFARTDVEPWAKDKDEHVENNEIIIAANPVKVIDNTPPMYESIGAYGYVKEGLDSKSPTYQTLDNQAFAKDAMETLGYLNKGLDIHLDKGAEDQNRFCTRL